PAQSFAAPSLPSLLQGMPALNVAVGSTFGLSDGSLGASFVDVVLPRYFRAQTRIADVEIRVGDHIAALCVTYEGVDGKQPLVHGGAGNGQGKMTLEPGEVITAYG